jgi:hypothetical protein
METPAGALLQFVNFLLNAFFAIYWWLTPWNSGKSKSCSASEEHEPPTGDTAPFDAGAEHANVGNRPNWN